MPQMHRSLQAYCATLNYFVQHRFSSPVPLIKKQRSLTEAVLISLGFTTESPKTLKRQQAIPLQWQIICCTVLTSCLQNLQAGSPLNRPMVCRCVLTGACPVRIATTILSWCLLNLSRSSALFLHGPLIKSLPCLWPGRSFQVQWCWFIIQVLIASLAKHLGIPRAGSGPFSGMADTCLASLSASSLPRMPQCPGTQTRVIFRPASSERAFRHSGIQRVLKSLSGH
jgi:hypothetical protein